MVATLSGVYEAKEPGLAVTFTLVFMENSNSAVSLSSTTLVANKGAGWVVRRGRECVVKGEGQRGGNGRYGKEGRNKIRGGDDDDDGDDMYSDKLRIGRYLKMQPNTALATSSTENPTLPENISCTFWKTRQGTHRY